jgi:PST family polysaccharide transporter
MLTNPTVVGYYSAAEKIVKAILGLLGPVSQAAYPRFTKMASESKAMALQWGQRMLLLMGSMGFILSISIFFGAPLIVRIVLGPEYEPSIMVMRILSGLCFLIGTSNVLGIQIMLPFGKDKAFTSILFGAGLINIALSILLAPIWQESGMAVAVLLSETFVTGVMIIYLQLQKLNPFLGLSQGRVWKEWPRRV